MSTAFRHVEEHDKDQLLRWRNLPEVREFMYADHVISPEEHERWFRGALSDSARRYWIIVHDGEEVGLVNLYAIDQKNRRCTWAFYVASPNVRGKGVGSIVEWWVLNQVFDNLKMNRLCCEVLVTNPAVINMHKKFGFVQEGLLREHAIKNGKPIDVVALAMLASDWVTAKPQVEARLREKGLI